MSNLQTYYRLKLDFPKGGATYRGQVVNPRRKDNQLQKDLRRNMATAENILSCSPFDLSHRPLQRMRYYSTRSRRHTINAR